METFAWYTTAAHRAAGKTYRNFFENKWKPGTVWKNHVFGKYIYRSCKNHEHIMYKSCINHVKIMYK